MPTSIAAAADANLAPQGAGGARRRNRPEASEAPAPSVVDDCINNPAVRIAANGLIGAASMAMGAACAASIHPPSHPNGIAGAAVEGLLGGLVDRSMRHRATMRLDRAPPPPPRGSDAWRELIMPAVRVVDMLSACTLGRVLLWGMGYRDSLVCGGAVNAAIIGAGITLAVVAVGASLAFGPRVALSS